MFVPLRHADEMEAEEGEPGNEVAGYVKVQETVTCRSYIG